jgi:hypothetical protein
MLKYAYVAAERELEAVLHVGGILRLLPSGDPASPAEAQAPPDPARPLPPYPPASLFHNPSPHTLRTAW